MGSGLELSLFDYLGPPAILGFLDPWVISHPFLLIIELPAPRFIGPC